MTAKAKDRILKKLQAFKPHGEIKGLEKYLSQLEAEGFVSVVRDTKGQLVLVRLTPKGKAFLESGGYVQRRKQKIVPWVLSHIWQIVSAVLIAVLTIIAAWWLKTTYGISDNPECGELSAIKNDSTFLSSASQFGLNDDSVASREKSLGVSLDNSKSTLASDSIRIPSIETSAVQSNVREESKAIPSGKL